MRHGTSVTPSLPGSYKICASGMHFDNQGAARWAGGSGGGSQAARIDMGKQMQRVWPLLR